MITLPFAAALTASVLSTAFISGVFGMAGGMILMNLLLAFVPLAPAMVLHGLTQIAANIAPGCPPWPLDACGSADVPGTSFAWSPG